MTKILLIAAVSFGAIFTGCEQIEKEIAEDVIAEVDASTVFKLSFDYTPPKDISADASYEELIKFAWDEFIALNWKSSYDMDALRDHPDESWNWGSDSKPAPELVVWETFAHRTELRPADDVMQPFDSKPKYSFKDAPIAGPGNPKFDLFNNLDENNEIGSCNMYGHISNEGESDMVLYQAKVNRDEYEYVRNTFGSNAKIDSAAANTERNIKKYGRYQKIGPGTCGCTESNVICLPCGGSLKHPSDPNSTETMVGAIEIKTAWRILTSDDNPDDFFKREVITYEKQGGTIVYENKTLALIGMHIIHKTKSHPNFIFATWEHVDVENDDMGFALLKNGKETEKPHTFERLHAIPEVIDIANKSVHDQIRAKNKNSIWLNYRLVGVQGTPINEPASESVADVSSFYLANYVIESDSTLAHFHGSNEGNPHNKKPNNLYKGQKISMGGCMGCHGATQLANGSDFSFLLNSFEKPITSPDVLNSTPTEGKMERYLEYLQEK